MRATPLLSEVISSPGRVPSTVTTAFTKTTLAEHEILALQEKFLTNGLHHIKVETIVAGRELLGQFLPSLQTIHHQVACITLSDLPLQNDIVDVYQELTLCQKVDGYDLEEFFIERFYVDFLWIEATPLLLKKEWFGDFEKKLLDYNIEKQIPIIVMLYEE